MPSRCRRFASRRWFLRSRLARYSAPPPSDLRGTGGGLRLRLRRTSRGRLDGGRLDRDARRVRRSRLAGGRARLGACGARRGRARGGRAGLVVGEHALQRAVAQVRLALGREADGLELPLVAGEHDGAPAGEGLPEALAELLVGDLVGGVEPLAVRGVGREQAARRGRRDRVHLGVLDRHQAVQPGALDEVAGDLDGALIPVRAADDDAGASRREPLDAGGAALARLEEQRIPQRGVVAAPVQEPEGRRGAGLELRLRAQQTGRDVGRHERRLDRQRARPAQRVQQAGAGGGLARPGRVQQQSGGQVLLERRLDLDLVRPVAAPVQALAAEVDRDGHARAREVRVDAHVGRARVDRRPLAAGGGAELVDDRVLDAHRAEARVPDPVVDAGEVDRERVVHAEVAGPVDGLCGLVELVAVGGLPAGQRQQHAPGEP